MLISFIIPSYNTDGELLRECLQSIISVPMDRDEREIIVVDDGSVVPVEEVMLRDEGGMREMMDEVKVIRKRNNGLGAARNTAMDAAKGEYLQFIDADDYLIAEEEMKVIERLRQGDTDMVMFHFANRKYHGRKRTRGVISGAQYMHENNLRATACLYAFRNTTIRFPERILHEDEQFTTLLTLNTKRLILIDAKPYFYRVSTDSIVTKRDKKWINRRLMDTSQVIMTLYDHRLFMHEEYTEEAFWRKLNQLCMDYLYNTVRLTHNPRVLIANIRHLQRVGLYPLPFHLYTWKYAVFSLLTKVFRSPF